MDYLTQFISKNSPAIVLTLAFAVVVLLILYTWLANRLARVKNRWNELLDGGSGSTLEKMLYDHLRERMALQEVVNTLQSRLHELENKMGTTKRHLGLIRYDAFEDVGGSQSFALALFDDGGNGAVITGLIGRSDSRVYCKPLAGGRSERSLSQEEQRAIKSATSGNPTVIVSS